jgi:hypothetical protein
MNPIRWEGETAIFTNEQVDVLGLPEEYGYTRYLVTDSVPIYQTSVNHWAQSYMVPKHRYSRIARFKRTVRNLFGESLPKLGDNVEAVISAYVKVDSKTPYNDCRSVLKHFGFPKYYKHIPLLLKTLKGISVFNIPLEIQQNFSNVLIEINERFKVLEKLIYQSSTERKYFPNMKYVALRIIQSLGIENVCIPLLRTKRKLKALDKFFNELEEIRKNNIPLNLRK